MYCLTAECRSQKTIDWYAANLKRFLLFLKSHSMPTSVKDIGVQWVFFITFETTFTGTEFEQAVDGLGFTTGLPRIAVWLPGLLGRLRQCVVLFFPVS